MYFFIEKYKISHQMVTFPWKELPDFHIFSHHDVSPTSINCTLLKQTIEKSIYKDCGEGKVLIRLKIQS